MKKITLAAFAGTALLSVAACSEANAPEADETAMDTDVPVAAPTATATATTTAAPDLDADPGNNVSVSEEGMSVDLNSGDTSISADVDESPSATVKTQ